VRSILPSHVPALSFYDQARSALAQAKTLAEVSEIADRGAAVREYARRAKDRSLLDDAEEIIVRAERRLGQMLDAVDLRPGQPRKNGSESEPFLVKPTLVELGIDKKLSSRAQKLASISERAIEARLAARRASPSRERVTTEILRDVDKRSPRAQREADLGAAQAAGNLEFPNKRYGVILADPEWRFEPWSRETGMDRAADNHYPTSITEVIAARPVQSIAAKDCVLFLWATVPMLPHALTIMAAWGFDYKSHIIAIKSRIGLGYWFRNEHELLLLGTCGDVPAPAPGTQWSSTRAMPIGRHSEKPDWQYELIEEYFPNIPKIELNARRARLGWDCWGLDAPKQTTTARNESTVHLDWTERGDSTECHE
jgi:N6-adenosine-specific RNA methylase IME4